MSDERAVIHFVVPVDPGKPGLPSQQPKNAALLPAVLKKALTGIGRRYVFACDPNLVPEFPSPHCGTGEAAHVNCLRCRATQAWKDAPDTGLYPKDPVKGREETKELDKFLVETPSQAVTSEV